MSTNIALLLHWYQNIVISKCVNGKMCQTEHIWYQHHNGTCILECKLNEKCISLEQWNSLPISQLLKTTQCSVLSAN